MYTVILSDGTKFSNLGLNGNNFISKKEVTEAMFEGKLSTVTISDGETVEVMKNAELIQISKMGDEWWFILREIPGTELAAQRMASAIVDCEEAIAEVYEIILGGE